MRNKIFHKIRILIYVDFVFKEMIEDALIHLNQKKSIPTRSGKDGSLGFQVENVRQIGENTREILTSGGKITTRGESPILLPHQG